MIKKTNSHGIKALVFICCLTIFLSSCATVDNPDGVTTLNVPLSFSGLRIPIFAELKESGNSFEFRNLTFNKAGPRHINLVSRQPMWDASKSIICSYGLATSLKRYPSCDGIKGVPSYYTDEMTVASATWGVLRFALTLGMSTFSGTNSLDFDEPLFQAAIDRAIINMDLSEAEIAAFEDFKTITDKYDFETLSNRRKTSHLKVPGNAYKIVKNYRDIKYKNNFSVKTMIFKIAQFVKEFRAGESDMDRFAAMYLAPPVPVKIVKQPAKIETSREKLIRERKNAEHKQQMNMLSELGREQNRAQVEQQIRLYKERQVVSNRAIRSIGARVCRDQDSGRLYGKTRYIGYVERVAEEKVQIRVADARIGRTSNLQPGGFKPSIIWDYPSNWKLCE